MAEYIERESVLEILRGRSAPWDGYQKVKELPAADVRPVVRGKWEEVEISYIEDMYENGNLPETIVSMYCPICERYHNEVYWYGNPTENINFCPNCGADMREPTKEE